MRRREFIILLGGTAAWPLSLEAQQRTVPVIGFLHGGSAMLQGSVTAFREGLRETGFVEGRNVAIEYRFAENQFERLPALAADLVQNRVAVIVTGAANAPQAAQSATMTIPVVFMSGGDPVRLGLVASLNRPGGNLTGVTTIGPDLAAKRFGLLHDLVPNASTIGVLADATLSNSSYENQQQALQAAARSIGVSLQIESARNERDLDAALTTFVRDRVGALFVSAGSGIFAFRDRLTAFAAEHRIPAAYQLREYVEAGGLMSYGPSSAEAFRQVGRYTGRILKGEKPADLPVMLPTRFEFVLNLKVANALGITIPPGMLAIVDAVIE